MNECRSSQLEIDQSARIIWKTWIFTVIRESAGPELGQTAFEKTALRLVAD
jgi:hypothetical protein